MSGRSLKCDRGDTHGDYGPLFAILNISREICKVVPRRSVCVASRHLSVMYVAAHAAVKRTEHLAIGAAL